MSADELLLNELFPAGIDFEQMSAKIAELSEHDGTVYCEAPDIVVRLYCAAELLMREGARYKALHMRNVAALIEQGMNPEAAEEAIAKTWEDEKIYVSRAAYEMVTHLQWYRARQTVQANHDPDAPVSDAGLGLRRSHGKFVIVNIIRKG